MANDGEAPPRQSWWQRRVVSLLVAQLRQGISPRQLALTVALGVVLGLFPIFGATTFLCGIAALWLRLNQPLIQTINYLVAPLQVLMLFPFYRAGETLFRATPVPIFSVTDLVERFWAGPWQFVIDYGLVGLYGITVWALLAPPLAVGLYFSTRVPITGLALRLRPRNAA